METGSNANRRTAPASKAKWLAGPLFVLLAGFGSVTHALAAQAGVVPELWNHFIDPSGLATGLEVDFQGDQTAVIPAQITNNIIINPFAALQQWNGTPVNPTTVTYDPVADITRVVFSGNGPLPSSVPADWPGPTRCNTYHAGLNVGAPVSPLNPFSPAPTEHWIYANTTRPVPTLTVSWDGTIKGKTTVKWAAVFVQAKSCAVGGWQLVRYAPNPQGRAVKFSVTNGGEKALRVGVIGFELGLSPPDDAECLETRQCAANQAALDSLNDEGFPPPGQEGSPFTAVKPPHAPLQPGDSFTFRAK